MNKFDLTVICLWIPILLSYVPLIVRLNQPLIVKSNQITVE